MNKAFTRGHKLGSVAHSGLTKARSVVVGTSQVTASHTKAGASAARDFFSGFAAAFKPQRQLTYIED